MAPLPTTDSELLKEHEFYDSGNRKSVLSFIHDYDTHEHSTGNNVLGILLMLAVLYLLVKRKAWILKKLGDLYNA